MNAFELYNERGKPTGIWCCGNCRKLVLSPTWAGDNEPKSTKEEAERCCRPPVCDTCHKEFKPRGSFDSKTHECPDCERRRWQIERDARLAKYIENAEDVTATYDGPVYVEGACGGDWGDGYFSSADYASEYLDDEDYDGIEWAFACTSRIEQMDIGTILEQLCSDGYEGMDDRLQVPQSLVDAVAEFNKINEQALTVWYSDYKRKVKVRDLSK